MLLPIIAVLLLGVVQAALVAKGELETVNAAREAARAAAVGDDPLAVVRLARGRVALSRWNDGDLVVIRLRFRQPTDVPLVGALVGDVTHEATIAMRRETDRPR